MKTPPGKVTTSKNKVVAICGNPNCGKTTIFNAITGLRQKVGNYPGVTVDKITGPFQVDGHADGFTLLDIPGSYSLAAFSPDEDIATRALCGELAEDEIPDIIIAVVDSTNLDRGLYFVFQVMQVGKPVVVALNMIDVATRQGIRVSHTKLAKLLGVPVVPIVASRGKGINRLKEAVGKIAANPHQEAASAYHPTTLASAERLRELVHNDKATSASMLRVLFDRNGPAEGRFIVETGDEGIRRLEEARERVMIEFKTLSGGETVPLMKRAAEIAEEVVTYHAKSVRSERERLDRWVLHSILGPIILLGVMVLMFQAVFTWAEPLMAAIDGLFGWLGGLVSSSMAEGPLQSLLVDGVIGGVGSVLVFLPQIVILFLFIAVLEDSGYMPRAAFIVDRLFSWCGLSGKSFIPMLSSFACAVPGIMAARTIENPRLRFVTIMVAPLMSCSARLPVYTILIAAFVPYESYLGIFNSQGLVLSGLYLLGLHVAIGVSFLLNRTIYRTERGSFMMEMPAYNWPTFKSVSIRVLNRVRSFVFRAGTVIFAITVVIWALSYYPRSDSVKQEFEASRLAMIEQFENSAEEMSAEINATRDALAEEVGPETLILVDEAIGGDSEAISMLQEAEGEELVEIYDLLHERQQSTEDYASALHDLDKGLSGAYLRDSYFGRLGRTFEPLFEPLGWDWKITMATLASFPAREVIIATLGTIYNLGADTDEESLSLIEKMRAAKWESGPKIGEPVFTTAVALSIMVFFALCAQCGATLVTIRHETGKVRNAVIAFLYMTFLAYVGGFVTYRLAIWGGLG